MTPHLCLVQAPQQLPDHKSNCTKTIQSKNHDKDKESSNSCNAGGNSKEILAEANEIIYDTSNNIEEKGEKDYNIKSNAS